MRLALIGAGRHGGRYLLPENYLTLPEEQHGWKKQHPGASIVAVCSNRDETNMLLAEAGSMGIDAAIIATRPDSHAELAIRCMRAGLHVLVEKPAALRYEDVQAMLAAAEREKRAFMVAHTYIFGGGWRPVHEAPEGDTTIRVVGPRPNRDWKTVPALVDWGSHAVAAALHLCGHGLQPLPIDGDVWRLSSAGTYVATLRGEGGRLVTVECGDQRQREQWLGVLGGGPFTPINAMVRAFKAVVDGEYDHRADPEFTKAVYGLVLS